MAQNRVYLVKMPSVAGTMPFLDIILQGPVGSIIAPVGIGLATPSPPGWGTGGPFIADSNGKFCEWRGRTFRTPILFGQPGFVPRLRLGWSLSVASVTLGDGCTGTPSVLYSLSLVGSSLAEFPDIPIPAADPSYGPVIRLVNSPDVQAGTFIVTFSSFEAKDEDRNPTGI